MNVIFRNLLVVFIVLIVGNSFAATTPFYIDNPDGSRTFSGHVPAVIKKSTILSHANPNQTLDLRVILPRANQADLDSLLKGLYDPTSPNFHKFLTPGQFNRQFGPSVSDLTSIMAYLKLQGLTVSQSANSTVLKVTGSVAAVEKAFYRGEDHIYNFKKNSDGTLYFAVDSDPTIPAIIVGKVSGITGLDNLAKFKPFSHRSASKLANNKTTAPQMGTGPCDGSASGCLAPSDVKIAYNLNTIPAINNPSTLQNVALFEMDGYLPSDIGVYLSLFNPSIDNFSNPCNYSDNYSSTLNPVYATTNFTDPLNPSCNMGNLLQNILIDGFNGNPTYSGGNAEVTLDIEQLLGMGYDSINKIYVYETGTTDVNWIDEWSQIATDNQAKIVSCSWGASEDVETSTILIFDHQVFEQMAAQGQEVFAASGDNGAYNVGGILTPQEPSSQPYLTGVGISLLSINANGTYQTETASFNSGGGISAYNSIPSYQEGMALGGRATSSIDSTSMRNAPDVVLTADSSTLYSFYISLKSPTDGSWGGWWGSSIAAPCWAAFMAQVFQGRANAGESSLGFINPALYSIAQGIKYSQDFHDITTGNNGFYLAQPGLDDATGLGSFNGLNLYNDLVSYSAASSIPWTPVLVAVSGNNSDTLNWAGSLGAVSYNVQKSSVSTGPFNSIANAITGTTYTDLTVQNGSIYYYLVSAVGSNGVIVNSNVVKVTPGVQAVAPSGLKITGSSCQPDPIVCTYINVNLQWTPSKEALSYQLKRGTSSGAYTISLGTVNASYTDTIQGPFTGMTTYYYAIQAETPAGASANSNEVSINLGTPAPPTGLTAIAGNQQVTLAWNASPGAAMYAIQEKVAGSFFTYISSTPSLNLTNTGLINGTTYYFEVLAISGTGILSNPSSAVSATPESTVVSLLNGTLIDTSTQQPITDILPTMPWNPQPTATGPSGPVAINPQAFPNFQMYNLIAGTYDLSFNLEGHTVNYSFTVTANSPYNYSRLQVPVPYIKTSIVGIGGTIIPTPGAYLVPTASNQTITVVPSKGYLPSLTVNGKPVTLVQVPESNKYHFVINNVIGAVIVVANFKLNSAPAAKPVPVS